MTTKRAVRDSRGRVSNLARTEAETRKALRLSPIAAAILTTACLSATPAFATVVFNDSFTLQTTNQSMWGAGSQAGWSYTSGFQGVSWGTYAGNSPVSGGINAIAGSSREVIIPAIPEVCIWAGACIPGTPAVTADTRTGAAVELSSSGKLGVVVTAQASGGGINVNLPVAAHLDITDNGNGVLHVSGNSAIQSGASITAKAPSFKAGVDGVINLDNSITATGCFIFAGCDTSSASLNIDPGKFSLIGLDTTKTKPISLFGIGVPIGKFGKEYTYRGDGPPCQGPADADGNAPTCDTSPFALPALLRFTPYKLQDYSGGTLGGNVLTLSNSTPILKTLADFTGIAQKQLGFPADVLNPSLNLGGIATVSGSLLDLLAGPTLGLTQSFSFDPKLQVTLEFDKEMTSTESRILGYTPQLIGSCRIVYHNDGSTGSVCDPNCQVTSASDFDVTNGQQGYTCDIGLQPITQQVVKTGKSVTLNVGSNADLVFSGAAGNLLNRTYSLADVADFSSRTGIDIDPTLQIKAGCFDFELRLGLGGTGLQCILNQTFHTGALADIAVNSSSFVLGGFNTAQFSSASPDPIYDFIPLDQPGPDLPFPDLPFDPTTSSNVPEPTTGYLTLLALAGLLGAGKWRRRRIGPAGV